jgi:hypothetical protein
MVRTSRSWLKCRMWVRKITPANQRAWKSKAAASSSFPPALEFFPCSSTSIKPLDNAGETHQPGICFSNLQKIPQLANKRQSQTLTCHDPRRLVAQPYTSARAAVHHLKVVADPGTVLIRQVPASTIKSKCIRDFYVYQGMVIVDLSPLPK